MSLLGIECDPSDWRVAAKLVQEGLVDRIRLVEGKYGVPLDSWERWHQECFILFLIVNNKRLTEKYPIWGNDRWVLYLNYEGILLKIKERWSFWTAWFTQEKKFAATKQEKIVAKTR